MLHQGEEHAAVPTHVYATTDTQEPCVKMVIHPIRLIRIKEREKKETDLVFLSLCRTDSSGFKDFKPRSQHAMAYDPGKDLVYIMGGTSLQETYMWDLLTYNFGTEYFFFLMFFPRPKSKRLLKILTALFFPDTRIQQVE